MKNMVFVLWLLFRIVPSMYGQENVPVNENRAYYYTIEHAALLENDQLLDSLYQTRSMGGYAITGAVVKVSQVNQDNKQYTSYQLRIGGEKYIYVRTLRPNPETTPGNRVVVYGALVKNDKPGAEADSSVFDDYGFLCEKMEDLTLGKQFRFRVSIPEAPLYRNLFADVPQ